MRKWDEPLISWSWFILAFDFKEEVTQTKKWQEKTNSTIVHFQERFLRERERARENQRETLATIFQNKEEEKGHKFQDKSTSKVARIPR